MYELIEEISIDEYYSILLNTYETRINDKRCKFVLETFHKFGADENVLAKADATSKNLLLTPWGESLEELAANLFYLLRDFDRTMPDVILAEGVGESGIGLAVMNRMRKAAGYQIVSVAGEVLRIKNGTLPSFMLK